MTCETKYPGLFVIGLTGGIATGKSTVAKILAEAGAEVIDADEVSHSVTGPGSEGWERVVRAFGADILKQDGYIDRKKLGELVFRDRSALDRLNSLVHPLVLGEIERRLSTLSQEVAGSGGQTPRLVVLDVPLLFEAGAERMADEVWVVYADPETQLRRLVERSGLERGEAELRVRAQWPLEEKVRRANVVIDNGRDLSYTRQQVMRHLARLREEVFRGEARERPPVDPEGRGEREKP